MTAKEYLKQAWNIDQKINYKLDQVAQLREMATKVTSTLSDTPRSGSHDNHKLDDIIARLVETEEEINKDIDRLINLKIDILKVVWSVEDDACRRVLELRYHDFKSWSDIALEMNVSLRWVHTLHSRGLKKVEKNLASSVKMH